MRKRICFVVAVVDTAQAFLRGHIEALSQEYDVYLAGKIKDGDDLSMLNLAGCQHIDIERGISLWHDLKVTWQAFRYFRRMHFDAVHSVTPKAGFVTALAARMAGIRNRTHIFTGQVWSTKNGLSRLLLKTIDKVIARLDTHIMCDGKSQERFLENEGVLRKGQALVFGEGSISGVDFDRFVPNLDARLSVRTQLGLSDDTLCFIFLGRLNHDKGIGELYEAFDRLATEHENIFLLLVGPDEEHFVDVVPRYKYIIDGRNFCFYGMVPNPEKVLNAGDIFVLPTYREGFGTSVLEAACIGLPCICSDAYGVLDAYVENETGLRCHVGDVDSLYKCMKLMYEQPDMRRQMGKRARLRVLKDFDGEKLTQHWLAFYHKILNK